MYYKVFYQCGEKAYLQHLLDNMASDDSDVRNSTLRSFIDILSPENERIIRDTVSHYYQNEDVGGTQAIMEELLDYIDNYEWE